MIDISKYEKAIDLCKDYLNEKIDRKHHREYILESKVDRLKKTLNDQCFDLGVYKVVPRHNYENIASFMYLPPYYADISYIPKFIYPHKEVYFEYMGELLGNKEEERDLIKECQDAVNFLSEALTGIGEIFNTNK